MRLGLRPPCLSSSLLSRTPRTDVPIPPNPWRVCVTLCQRPSVRKHLCQSSLLQRIKTAQLWLLHFLAFFFQCIGDSGGGIFGPAREIFLYPLNLYWPVFCTRIFCNPVQYREHRVESWETWAGVLALPPAYLWACHSSQGVCLHSHKWRGLDQGMSVPFIYNVPWPSWPASASLVLPRIRWKEGIAAAFKTLLCEEKDSQS